MRSAEHKTILRKSSNKSVSLAALSSASPYQFQIINNDIGRHEKMDNRLAVYRRKRSNTPTSSSRRSSFEDEENNNHNHYNNNSRHYSTSVVYGSPVPGGVGFPGIASISSPSTGSKNSTPNRKSSFSTSTTASSNRSSIVPSFSPKKATPTNMRNNNNNRKGLGLRSASNTNSVHHRDDTPVLQRTGCSSSSPSSSSTTTKHPTSILKKQGHHSSTSTTTTTTPRKRVVKISSPKFEQLQLDEERRSILEDEEEREMLIEALVYQKMKKELARMGKLEGYQDDDDEEEDDDEGEDEEDFTPSQMGSPSLCQITELSPPTTKSQQKQQQMSSSSTRRCHLVDQEVQTEEEEKKLEQLEETETEETEQEQPLSASDFADLVFLLETQQSDFRLNIERDYYQQLACEILSPTSSLMRERDEIIIAEHQKKAHQQSLEHHQEEVTTLNQRIADLEKQTTELKEQLDQATTKNLPSPSPSPSPNTEQENLFSWQDYRQKLLHFIELTSNKQFSGTFYTIEDLESTLDASVIDLRAAAALARFTDNDDNDEYKRSDKQQQNTGTQTSTTATKSMTQSQQCDEIVFDSDACDTLLRTFMNTHDDDSDDTTTVAAAATREARISLLELRNTALEEKNRRLSTQLERSWEKVVKSHFLNTTTTTATNTTSSLLLNGQKVFTQWREWAREKNKQQEQSTPVSNREGSVDSIGEWMVKVKKEKK